MPSLTREQCDAVLEYVDEHREELVEKDPRVEEFHRGACRPNARTAESSPRSNCFVSSSMADTTKNCPAVRIWQSPKTIPTMPPHEECPNCRQIVEDWHIEWYMTEGPTLYKGLAAMDCPLCGQPVGFQQGKIGPAPHGVSIVRRHAEKAAQWAAFQAVSAGGTLQDYTSASGAGLQYARYWTPQEVRKADANEQAKKGP
jgi:hypothetical protein